MDGRLDLPGRRARSHDTRRSLWFTLWQATVSTALTLARGPAARLGARAVPLPRPVARAGARRSCRSSCPRSSSRPRSSRSSRTGSSAASWAILLAHVFFNVAVVVRVVGGFWARLDPRLWDAAATLGASPAQRRSAADAPAPRSGARVGGVDRVPLLLHLVRRDRHPRRPALRDARDGDLQPRRRGSSTCGRPRRSSLLQLGAGRGDRRRLRGGSSGGSAGARSRRAQRAAAGRPGADRASRARRACSVASAGAPASSPSSCARSASRRLRLRPLRPRSSDETPALFVAPWHAVLNSLLVRGRCAPRSRSPSAVPAAVAVARRPARGSTCSVMLPLGASAVMLGFGFLIALRRRRRSTSARRAGSSRSRSRSSRCRSSCASSPRRSARSTRGCARPRRRSAPRPARSRREIDAAARSARPLAVAAGFAFAVALGEFGATVFVARADQPTLPVAIFRFLGRPGAENQSAPRWRSASS